MISYHNLTEWVLGIIGNVNAPLGIPNKQVDNSNVNAPIIVVVIYR